MNVDILTKAYGIVGVEFSEESMGGEVPEEVLVVYNKLLTASRKKTKDSRIGELINQIQNLGYEKIADKEVDSEQRGRYLIKEEVAKGVIAGNEEDIKTLRAEAMVYHLDPFQYAQMIIMKANYMRPAEKGLVMKLESFRIAMSMLSIEDVTNIIQVVDVMIGDGKSSDVILVYLDALLLDGKDE